MCILSLFFIACKKEGVSLVSSGLRDRPTDRKGAFTWVTAVNRGQVVTILEEQKSGDWVKVQLADGVTRGWIRKIFIHHGGKRVIVFTEQATMYDQPDPDSRIAATIPAGEKALVFRTKDRWYEVNISWDRTGWVRKGTFKRGTDMMGRFRHEVVIKGIGRSFVEASAMLPEWAGYSYSVMNLFDGSPGTTWQVGNGGIGDWVELTFPEQASIQVSMINGFVRVDPRFARYGAHGDLYELNNRVKSMRVDYWDSRGVQRSSTVNFADNVRDYQNAGFFKNVSQIRFIIESVYKGLKWNDTAVAEIRIDKRR
jgi:SH3-like domain-containing protein